MTALGLTPGDVSDRRRRAMLESERGRLPEADEELTKLLRLLAPASTPPMRLQLVYLLNDRATVRRQSNRWEEALSDLSESERLAGGMGLATRLTALGAVYHARAKIFADPFFPGVNYDEARRLLTECRKQGALEFACDELEGELAVREGDWETAAKLALRAAEACDEQGWLAGAAACRRKAGDALLNAGRISEAEDQLGRAKDFFTRWGSPRDLASTLMSWAQLRSAQGHHDDAWAWAGQALDHLGGLIRSFRVLTEQQRFLIDKLQQYDKAFDIALARGGSVGNHRAWNVAERAKSFYLCQIVASANIDLFEGADPAQVAELRRLEQEFDECDRERSLHLRDSDRSRELDVRLNELSEKKGDALDSLMRANPKWGRVNVPSKLDMESELSAIPKGWVLLSYYWRSTSRDTYLHVFWAGKGEAPRHACVEWSQDDLASLDFARRTLRDSVPQRAKVIPRGLGKKILPAEVLQSLPSGACLCISPHGRLQMIPLHAVRSGPEEYVALRWPVCYLPTFALLPLKRPTTATRRVLLAGCERDGFGSPTLPGVKEELNEIQKTWSDLDSQNLIRRHLEPEENLESAGIPLDRWAEFDLLHVACHGVFPDGRPFDAALRLGSQALRTSQFFGVRIDASLAAFSACSVGRSAESAAGQRVVGDEWLGFCLPLLYSGVGSVLASLWNANSEQAALLMLHLHRALHQGDSPVVALHKALDERIGPCPEACWANWYVVGFPG